MKQYESYKLIADERISQIPKQWMSRKLKHVTGFAYGDSLKDEDRHKDGEVPVFGSNGQVGNHSVANTKGPAIIIGRKGSYGKLTYTEKPSFAIDTTYYVDKTITKSNLRWLYYTLKILDLDGFTQDSAIPGLSRDFAYSKFVPLPGIKEQAVIAGYLDTETDRIDQLITNKRQQIEKLNELRQVTISRAVTQGLNPDVPMKDSGVEWLGNIPKHWCLSRVKYLGCFIGGGTPSKDNPDYWNGNIPWVSPKDMKRFEIHETIDNITNKAISDSTTQVIPIGSMLMVVRSGILQHSIPVAINEVSVTLNQDMKAFIPNKRIHAKFLAYLILGRTKDLLIEWCKLGATVESLEFDLIKNSKIPLPDYQEQDVIIRYVEKEVDKLNRLKSNFELQIQKLKELRKITIHNAVTGKIKVTD